MTERMNERTGVSWMRRGTGTRLARTPISYECPGRRPVASPPDRQTDRAGPGRGAAERGGHAALRSHDWRQQHPGWWWLAVMGWKLAWSGQWCGWRSPSLEPSGAFACFVRDVTSCASPPASDPRLGTLAEAVPLASPGLNQVLCDRNPSIAAVPAALAPQI